MITIKEIAKLAGVSPGTVDRVIHRREGVSLKTKSRVEEIMKVHNFRINTVARSLALKKSYSVAVLMPEFDNENLFWRSPYLGTFKAGEEVAHLGIKIEHFFFDQLDEYTYSDQCKAIVEADPDAVLFTPYFAKETRDFSRELELREIPYLFLNINLKGFNNLSFLGQDAYRSGFLSAKLFHLCTGPNRVCLVPHIEQKMQNNSVLEQRFQGFKDYFRKHELPFKMISHSIGNLDDPGQVKRSLSLVMEEAESIDGIWVPSSRISVVVQCLERDQIESLALIGFDTTPQNLKCLKDGRITFLISQKSFNQGYVGVKVIADFLVHKIIPSSDLFSPIEILTRENLDFSQRSKKDYLYESGAYSAET